MTKRDQQYRDYVAEHREPPVPHTPGDWWLLGEEAVMIGADAFRGKVITDAACAKRIIAVVPSEDGEGVSNGRLIEMTPELLAALEKLVSEIESFDDMGKIFDASESARMVIMKARGLLR